MSGISENRQNAFNIGTLLMGLGVVIIVVSVGSLILSPLPSPRVLDPTGNPFSPGARGFDTSFGPPGEFFFFFIGMVVLIAGAIMRGVGAAGLAGSGVILDPERARHELQPFSRAAGGLVGDVIEESGIGDIVSTTKVVVKCRDCGAHNDEEAKYCDACGSRM